MPVEESWRHLLARIESSAGVVMLIGKTDTGKSTLSRYLIRRLLAGHYTVTLIDTDIGQSSLGLPGTISKKRFRGEGDSGEGRPDRMVFLGTTNPAKVIHEMIVHTKRYSDSAKKPSDLVIIDTTGLVSGNAGIALKVGKIRAVAPEHIVALQRSDELEQILRALGGITVHRLKPSAKARVRSRAARIAYRKLKLSEYFMRGQSEFLIGRDEARFYYRGRVLHRLEPLPGEGNVVGLNHDDETIDLGMLMESHDDRITVRSPLRSVKMINRVITGDIVL